MILHVLFYNRLLFLTCCSLCVRVHRSFHLPVQLLKGHQDRQGEALTANTFKHLQTLSKCNPERTLAQYYTWAAHVCVPDCTSVRGRVWQTCHM